jgi:hypothetical protein
MTQDFFLYSFESGEPTRVLRLPSSVTLEELRAFVAKIEGIDSSQKEKLLLFQNRRKTRVPDVRPLIRAPSIDFDRLYYLLPDQRATTDVTVVVAFSADSFNQTSQHFFFTTLPAGFARIRRVMEPLAKGQPLRILRTGQGVIRLIETPDQDLLAFRPEEEEIRFEIIPENQRGMSENQLVKVMRVVVGTSDLLTPKGAPFYLRIDRGATLEAVKDQIQTALNKPQEVMTHYRFMIIAAPRRGIPLRLMFRAADVLKKDAIVGGVIDPATQLFVMIIPADEAVVSRNLQEVKIRS